MRKNLLLSLLILLSCFYYLKVNARVRLPDLVSSNMVLQRNTTITLWGWADPGEKFTVSASWLKNPIPVTVDKAGDWKVNVSTTKTKQPQSIKITGNKEVIALDNILFGEVWLCSGQSNMEIPISGFLGQPVYGAQEAITSANDENIRLFSIAKQASILPENQLSTHST